MVQVVALGRRCEMGHAGVIEAVSYCVTMRTRRHGDGRAAAQARTQRNLRIRGQVEAASGRPSDARLDQIQIAVEDLSIEPTVSGVEIERVQMNLRVVARLERRVGVVVDRALTTMPWCSTQ